MASTKKPASSAAKASTLDTNTGYAEAIEELESILAELESDDVDVDELAEHVQRASQLIELCRERIGKAKLRIEEVVSQLEADEAESFRNDCTKAPKVTCAHCCAGRYEAAHIARLGVRALDRDR